MDQLNHQVTVRDMKTEDISEVIQVITHPKVIPHQYPISSSEDKEAAWLKQLNGENVFGPITVHHRSILLSGKVIGHITLHKYLVREKKIVSCGWNLHPEFWGNRYMHEALRIQFDELIDEQNVEYIIADCFRNNQRCIRLLERLHDSVRKHL